MLILYQYFYFIDVDYIYKNLRVEFSIVRESRLCRSNWWIENFQTET